MQSFSFSPNANIAMAYEGSVIKSMCTEQQCVKTTQVSLFGASYIKQQISA